jgi:hypothetical protein
VPQLATSGQISVRIILAAIFLAACDRGININKLKPDAELSPVCVSGPDVATPGCRVAVDLCRDQAGRWTVVVPKDATYQRIVVTSDGDLPAAATVDWEDTGGSVAGLVLSVRADLRPLSEVAKSLTAQIAKSGAFEKVEVLQDGQASASHDGHPMVRGIVLDLTPASATALAKARNRLFPALTGLDIVQFKQLPESPAETSDRFRAALSATSRAADGRLVVTAALATLDAYNNLLGKARTRVADMASGSMVGTDLAQTTARCETLDFDAPATLDALWVLSGSDSNTMENARTRLHSGSGMFWNRARHYSIDLRAAVVDMNQLAQVRLCNPSPLEQGRFFTMARNDADLLAFQQCLLKPSGIKPPSAVVHGLQSAKNTLLSLLSRADDHPQKLRRETQVAVVFAADVEAGSVADAFGGKVPDPLTPDDKKKVDAVVSPLANLLSTSPQSELLGTRAFALVVDPSLDAGCTGRRGTGYIELLSRLGRAHENLCKSSDELETLLEETIDELAPLASRLALGHPSAAGTLSVTLNGGPLFRSLKRGFDHDAARNRLLLRGLFATLAPEGNRAELRYVGW